MSNQLTSDKVSEIEPTKILQAKAGTFLWTIQNETIAMFRGLYPNGQRFDSGINLGLMTAKNDLCKINDERYQSHRSIIMGPACKKEFVKVMAIA